MQKKTFKLSSAEVGRVAFVECLCSLHLSHLQYTGVYWKLATIGYLLTCPRVQLSADWVRLGWVSEPADKWLWTNIAETVSNAGGQVTPLSHLRRATALWRRTDENYDRHALRWLRSWADWNVAHIFTHYDVYMYTTWTAWQAHGKFTYLLTDKLQRQTASLNCFTAHSHVTTLMLWGVSRCWSCVV